MPEFPIKVFTADRFQLVHNEQEYQTLLDQFTYIRAAGGLVFNDVDELLMIFRRGKWDLPKGKVEDGEDVVTAALREVKEETGVSAEVIGGHRFFRYHTYSTYGTPMLKETAWFEMQALPGQQLSPQSEEDIAQAVWVPIAEVDDKLRNSYESVRDLWEEVKNSRK